MEPATRAVVLPIFRHHWLWHAWREGSLAEALAAAGQARGKPAPPPERAGSRLLRRWQEGMNLEEKTQLLGQHVTRWVQNRLSTEWRKLETAREGSLRNRGYRMAQAVLSREDPRETFLKNLPTKPAPIEVIYPTGFREKLVRRRLRHVVSDGRRRHTTRLLWWALAMLPQLPLMLTPLPNLTVYYTGYRIYSHYRALQGAKALEQNLEELDSRQLSQLRTELLSFQERHPGFNFRPKEWPEKLIRKEHRYMDMLESMTRLARLRELRRLRDEGEKLPEWQARAGERDQAAAAQPQPLLTFTPSVDLNELVRPADRLHTPLPDDAAMAIGQLLGVENLIELVARSRRRVLGSSHPHISMFPPGAAPPSAESAARHSGGPRPA